MKSYFQNSQNKYNPLLSEYKPVVVRIVIDSKNEGLDFDDNVVGGVSDSLNSFAKKFSKEYGCIGVVNFNEINFIFEDVKVLKRKFKRLETQALTSFMSQDIFYRINNELNLLNKLIYIKVNTFNIFDNKLKTYIKHRQIQGFNSYLRYYSSRYFNFSEYYGKSMYELFEKIKSVKIFSDSRINYIKNGFIYKQGCVVDISDLDKNIKDIKKQYKNNRIEVNILESSELDNI